MKIVVISLMHQIKTQNTKYHEHSNQHKRDSATHNC